MPLAIALADKYEVIGFDTNIEKINDYKKGVDSTSEVSLGILKDTNLIFTNDVNGLENINFYIITVPTPINSDKTPDLEPLKNASKIIGGVLKKGDVIVYESTVYPGTTEEVCVPILEEVSNLQLDIDFSVGYSPERINPGDKEQTLTKIKKVISASNEEALQRLKDVYGSIIEAGLYITKSIKVAEAAKVIENAQRDINIAFMNELSKVFTLMDIDTEEVLEAARTKWNFLDFRPGLVGGHCIGVDPYYFIYKAEQLGYRSQIISAARRVNEQMIEHVVSKILKLAIKAKIDTRNIKVSVLGVTFKPNCNDIRNSKVFDIINALEGFGWEVAAYDPNVHRNNHIHELVEREDLRDSDIVILSVPHDNIVSNFGIEEISSLFKANNKKVFIDLYKIHAKEARNNTEFIYWGL